MELQEGEPSYTRGTPVSKLITKVLAGLAALAVVAGLAYLARPDAEAPKRDDLTFDRPASHSASPTTATTLIPLRLFNELQRGEYTHEPFQQKVKDGRIISTQIWVSPDGHRVELAATGSAPMSLRSITYPGNTGRWRQFWCGPESNNETLTYMVNTGELARRDIESGITGLSRDIETPAGAKFVRLTNLNGEPLMTCYVK